MVNPIDNENYGSSWGESPRMFLGQDVLQSAVLANWVQALNALSPSPYTIAGLPQEFYDSRQFMGVGTQGYAVASQQSVDYPENDTLGSVTGNTIKGVGKVEGNLIEDASDMVADGVRGLGEIDIHDVVDSTLSGFDQVVDKTSDITAGAVYATTDAVGWLGDTVHDFGSWLGDAANDFGSGIGGVATDVADWGMDEVKDIFGGIADTFTGKDGKEERKKNREEKNREKDNKRGERNRERDNKRDERNRERDNKRDERNRKRDNERQEISQRRDHEFEERQHERDRNKAERDQRKEAEKKQGKNEDGLGKKLSNAAGDVVQGMGHAAGAAVEGMSNVAGNVIEGQGEDKRKDILLTNNLPNNPQNLPYNVYTPDNYLSTGFGSLPSLLLPAMKMMQEYMSQQLGGIASLAQGLYDAGASNFADMVTGGMPELEQRYPELFTPEYYGLDQGSVRTVGAEQNASNPYGLADGLIEGGSWKGQGLNAAAAQSPRFDGPSLDPYSNKNSESRGLQA